MTIIDERIVREAMLIHTASCVGILIELGVQHGILMTFAMTGLAFAFAVGVVTAIFTLTDPT